MFIISTVLFVALQFTSTKATPLSTSEGCACATRNGSPVQYEDQDGDLQGNCAIKAKAGPNKGKFFCYVEKNGPCECQAESSRTRKYCINFDLCDVEKNADAVYNPLYYSYPYGR